MKLKRKLLIMIMTNILLLQNLTAENFAARLAQANLASKRDIANFVKKIDFDDKLKNLHKKLLQIKLNMYLLKMNFKKLQTFELSLFIGQSYFNNDGAQFYFIFQHFMFLKIQSQNGSLRDCQMKNLSVLI